MSSSLNILLDYGRPVKFSPNDLILKEAKKSRDVYLVQEGVVRHFVYDTNREEKTIRISKEGDFFYSSIVSYFTEEPTYINCQALTLVRMIHWTKDVLEPLLEQNKSLDQFRYQQLTQFIIEKHQRELSLITHTAENRYHEFCRSNAQLFNRIPHRIIASYLNMTPETLSRLRKKTIS